MRCTRTAGDGGSVVSLFLISNTELFHKFQYLMAQFDNYPHVQAPPLLRQIAKDIGLTVEELLGRR